ncbi:MAG TPA: alpha/beta fold hydrolase, partial [Acidimicrobiia bacterium]|nr:alpha/beta fold hydrolase [Acidimicrobiia bacterium]
MGTRTATWCATLVAAVAVSSMVVSCGTSNHADRTGSLVWHPCGQIECTTLSVPLDWSHPSGGLVSLRLARRPASGRRVAVLFTNPGGPGGSGVELVQQSAGAFDASVLDRFDIVSWDPRGVAASTPAACGTHLDYFYAVDRTDTDAATAAANVAVSKRLVGACEHASKGLLPYLSTSATVRDMDAIRAAMGVTTIDYLGFSYGTYIGA